MNIIVWIAVCCTLEVTELLGCPEIKILNGTYSDFPDSRGLRFTCDENFELVGTKFAICTMAGIWSTHIPFCVGTTCPMEEVTSGLIVKKLYKGGVLSLTCDPGLVRVGSQRIMCLAGEWNKQLPVCTSLLNLKCDFEHEDLCGWSQDTDDEFDWIWHQGSTPTQNTGPLNDHTLQSASGHYLFIESDSPHKFGDRARLLSPVYTSGTVDGMCLQFYYHMSGPNKPGEVGNLDVYILEDNTTTSSDDTTQYIFHREGNQGDHWIQAEVYISPRNTTLQLVFQATRLSGPYSDIAIDDVSIQSCSQSPQLMLSLALGANYTPRELTTKRTFSSQASTSAREAVEIISPATQRNNTLDNSEKRKATVAMSTHPSIQETMSSEKAHTHINIPSLANPVSDKLQTDGNITSQNVSPLNKAQTDSDINLFNADKTQRVSSTPSHTHLSSHNTLTTTKIPSTENDVDNDKKINSNQDTKIFHTRHTIILNVTILFSALAAALSLAWSWVRHRRSRGRVKQAEAQKRLVNTTGCIPTDSRNKSADSLV